MATPKAVSATIERHPEGRSILSVYAMGERNKYIIDLREGSYKEVVDIFRHLYRGTPIEEVFYDVKGEVIPVRVFWTNHGYYSQEQFANVYDAIAYGKSKCFEFALHLGDTVLAGWSPIGGLRTFTEVARG